MYELKTALLPYGHRLRPRGSYTITSITIHSTGNPNSTADQERRWLDNPSNTRDAAWHYVAGENIVIQAIPDNEEAWHCGVSYGNKHSIGIELIESGNRKAVIETAAEFTAFLLKEYNLKISDIKRHFDWTGKNCPRILIDKNHIYNNMNWEYFLSKVKEYLNGDEMVEKIRVIVDGKEIEVDRILKDGYNYIKIRDIANLMGYNLSNKGSIPMLTKKN